MTNGTTQTAHFTQRNIPALPSQNKHCVNSCHFYPITRQIPSLRYLSAGLQNGIISLAVSMALKPFDVGARNSHISSPRSEVQWFDSRRLLLCPVDRLCAMGLLSTSLSFVVGGIQSRCQHPYCQVKIKYAIETRNKNFCLTCILTSKAHTEINDTGCEREGVSCV